MTMDQELADFLAANTPSVEQVIIWGEMHFAVKSVLCTDMPPVAFITSVRSVLFHNDQVLVVRDPTAHHILPGGRVESGESLTDTLRRELLEETGWTINQIHYLGFKHFHHLTPRPDQYSYPYPDFLQAIYVSQAVEFHAESQQSDEYVLDVTLHDLEQARALSLSEDNYFYLEAALKRVRQDA